MTKTTTTTTTNKQKKKEEQKENNRRARLDVRRRLGRRRIASRSGWIYGRRASILWWPLVNQPRRDSPRPHKRPASQPRRITTATKQREPRPGPFRHGDGRTDGRDKRGQRDRPDGIQDRYERNDNEPSFSLFPSPLGWAANRAERFNEAEGETLAVSGWLVGWANKIPPGLRRKSMAPPPSDKWSALGKLAAGQGVGGLTAKTRCHP